MTDPIVELAKIRLAKGKTEADLLAASDQFQKDFLDAQDGFIRRELVREPSGDYIDIIHWESQAHADAVGAKIETSEDIGAYFSLMDFDPEAEDAMPVFHQSLQVHSAKP